MNLAQMLRDWRKVERLSTTEAARILAIDRKALMRLEKGETVGHPNLVAIIFWMLS